MRRTRSVVALLLLSLVLGACWTPGKWTHAPEARQDRAPETLETLVVPPFADGRGTQADDNLGWAWMPLMPFGWATWDRPEAPNLYKHGVGIPAGHLVRYPWPFEPTKDLSVAIAEEIDAARIFRSARAGPDTGTADYVLNGTVTSTRFHFKRLTYGFTPLLSWIPHLLGLPNEATENGLEFRLELVQSSTGRVIWQHDFEVDDMRVHWVYSRSGYNDDLRFDELLKRRVIAMAANIRAAIRKVE